MAKNRDIQNIGIVFGDWKLIPLDDRNWELCHRHMMSDTEKTRSAGTAGTLRWVKLGRYYSYNTFDLAVQYAADVELKAKAEERVMELQDALAEYRTIVDTLKADVVGALREVD